MTDHFLTIDNNATVFFDNNWTLDNFVAIDHALQSINWPKQKTLIFSGERLQKMDSAGALQFNKLIKQLNEQGFKITLKNFVESTKTIIDLIAKEYSFPSIPQEPPSFKGLAWLGKYIIDFDIRLYSILSFIGEMAIVAMRLPFHLQKIHWRAFFSAIEATGYRAIPIITLLNF